MKRFNLLTTILVLSFIFMSSSSVVADTWEEDCNICTGDPLGVHSCTTMYCGKIDSSEIIYDDISVGTVASYYLSVPKPDLTPVLCDNCSKNMKNQDGSVYIGMMISGRVIGDYTDQIAYMKNQFGEFEINKDYQFCYECLLKAMMGN